MTLRSWLICQQDAIDYPAAHAQPASLPTLPSFGVTKACVTDVDHRDAGSSSVHEPLTFAYSKQAGLDTNTVPPARSFHQQQLELTTRHDPFYLSRTS